MKFSFIAIVTIALSSDVTAQLTICTRSEPCGHCFGGCTSDDDCHDSLICWNQIGNDQPGDRDDVPGCFLVDFSETNFCIFPGDIQVDQEEDVFEENNEETQTTIGYSPCNENGVSMMPYHGKDSTERMLLREGVIDEIRPNLCEPEVQNKTKNVILVIGDGMGWEMVRAGSIARQIIDELESLGCDPMVGCPDNEEAIAAFQGRTLSDYYTEGYGSGLSFQELEGRTLVTTSAPVLQQPNKGNHYAPQHTLLQGSTSDHNDRMAPLVMNSCGFPVEFNPSDISEGGMMSLWNDEKGGEFPWDANYYTAEPDTSTGFDPTFIMQNATDSASTAGSYATGVKAAVGQLSQDLYEEEALTILEEARFCGKAGGVVTSVPMFHATPGAFILHSNNRSNRDQLRTSWIRSDPTVLIGMCGGNYYPYPEQLQQMINGTLADKWTFLYQNEDTLAEDFYSDIGDVNPNNGEHLLVCLGGDYTASGETNMPYRGVDSTFQNRHCSSGEAIKDPDTGLTVGVNVTTSEELCNHYEPEEIEHIPSIQQNIMAALDVLSKDDDGFFFMYEQGDIDWAAHANHMDDLLGTMLDIDESVRIIMDWIEENGGFEKNALYVSADHDHYLTLKDDFPEALATLLIDGNSHLITPFNNSDTNTMEQVVDAGHADDDSKTQTEHLADFSTWSESELDMVAHYWGPYGSGGNGWGSHSSRPIPMWYAGDDGCIEALQGKGYQIVGKEVAGSEGKVDEVHVHACMKRALFAL